MYAQLKKIHHRPAVFSIYTADTLWTQPHLANQMLQLHLSQDTALASRPMEAIDRVVGWIDRTIGLKDKAVCDLGCGPGLYASRFAAQGAIVHGIDFSANSIAYAEKHGPAHGTPITYRVANYLTDPLPADQDPVTLIYCDLCPLSPTQRQTLLNNIRQILNPGGKFIFDVFSENAFLNVEEGVQFEQKLMNGLWSGDDYFAFQHTYRYEDESVSLDHFTIIEESRCWEVYNWLQYFSTDTIRAELEQAGFRTIEFTDGFGLDSTDPSTFGVIASV